MSENVITSMEDGFKAMREANAQRHGLDLTDLKGGGGGGTYDDMERRVTKLEDKVDKLIDRATAVEVNLATLSERIAHLPSKEFIVKVVVGSLSVFGALSLFGSQIKAALGIH